MIGRNGRFKAFLGWEARIHAEHLIAEFDSWTGGGLLLTVFLGLLTLVYILPGAIMIGSGHYSNPNPPTFRVVNFCSDFWVMRAQHFNR